MGLLVLIISGPAQEPFLTIAYKFLQLQRRILWVNTALAEDRVQASQKCMGTRKHAHAAVCSVISTETLCVQTQVFKLPG